MTNSAEESQITTVEYGERAIAERELMTLLNPKVGRRYEVDHPTTPVV